CLGAAPHARLLPRDREALARAAAAGPDHEGRALARDLVEVDRRDLARLADLVADRCLAGLLPGGYVAQEGSALLAIVRPLRVDEPTLGAVHGAGAPGATAALSRRRPPAFACRRGCP